MDLEQLQAYEVLEKKKITDLKSTGYIMKHKKSGARLVLISNDDDNKVFTIGFRTPPEDSTGLPHILEHSVLCGSKNYPVKDPFVELVKGSLNTFLNALTYPDKTVYPVASCNDTDFQNLMNVYLDAVFYPNIYEREEIFKQEGWHYQLENADAPLEINGVVYNEMKGEFSSPDSILGRSIMNSLFPDIAYGVESGGDPDCIPDLTYEKFLDFHGKYYHPSNSYIYLYGNMDMAEKLMWMDELYLSKFDKIEIDSSIREQKTFSEMKKQNLFYPVTEDEPLEENSYLSYNKVIGSSQDSQLYYAFQVLDYALFSAPGAPVKQALIDAKIGTEIMSIFENGINQMYFSVVAKKAEVAREEEFISLITETLSKLVQDKIDRKALEAGINLIEFKFREADFGNFPKGLIFGLQMFDSWLYNEEKPFLHIEALNTFAFLKEMLQTDYFEQLVSKYLLDNSFGSYITMQPQRGLTAQKDKKLADRLAKLKQSLDPKKIEEIIMGTKELLDYQKEPSTPEELATIPVLKRSDIKKETQGIHCVKHEVNQVPILFHEENTNGIGYVKLLFDAKAVPQELLPYVGILKCVLGNIDTKHYSYGDLSNEINRKSGGMNVGFVKYSDVKNIEEYRMMFYISADVLYEKLPFAFEMAQEIIHLSRLDDTKRLREIVAELKSRMQMRILCEGNSFASTRAMSYFSSQACIDEQTEGIAFYELIKSIDENFDERKDELVSNLERLMEIIFCKGNLLVDYTAEKEGYAGFEQEAGRFAGELSEKTLEAATYHFELEKKNEGFKTASQVQYVARCGNYRKKGLPYSGALLVLRVMMSYGYLWDNVRVMGGAYGCRNSYEKAGNSGFVSYRDPNLRKTNDIYEKAADFVADSKLDEGTLTKYVIGAISTLDTPLNPSAKGLRALGLYLTNQTIDDLQKERDQVLSITEEELRKQADIIRAVLEENCLCVIGNEDKIEEQKDLFHTVRTI